MLVKHWYPVCDKSQKAICTICWVYRITICNVEAEGKVRFVKRLQRSPTGQLILLDGCVSFCEKFVVREREF